MYIKNLFYRTCIAFECKQADGLAAHCSPVISVLCGHWAFAQNLCLRSSVLLHNLYPRYLQGVILQHVQCPLFVQCCRKRVNKSCSRKCQTNEANTEEMQAKAAGRGSLCSCSSQSFMEESKVWGSTLQTGRVFARKSSVYPGKILSWLMTMAVCRGPSVGFICCLSTNTEGTPLSAFVYETRKCWLKSWES